MMYVTKDGIEKPIPGYKLVEGTIKGVPLKMFCKMCLEDPDIKYPLLRAPGSTWCTDHRREYHRQRYHRVKAEQQALLDEYTETMQPRDKYGLTEAEFNAEMERLDRMYGGPEH